MATADRAFINAEQRAFNWLETKLSDITAGANGYIGELPIALGEQHPVVKERQMWMFGITGQNETMSSNVGNPVHCHKATAIFRGMFETREMALNIVGSFRSFLPAQVHSLVQRLDYSEGLTIGRDVVELRNDQDKGGLHRIWIVEQPLWIQFSNDDETIGYEGN